MNSGPVFRWFLIIEMDEPFLIGVTQFLRFS